ncbi:HDOD domain-containing protein, partial [bacterium]
MSAPLYDRHAVDAIVDRMGELAALPHVVFQVIDASNDPNAPAAAIERAVTVDPGFAAKLLAEANSATFGNAAHVSSIREAVMRLGFTAVRNLALAVGTFDLFVGKSDAESLRRRAWWKTSVDTAMYAKWVAHRTRAAKPDDAYTGGLLHLVGKTVLDRCGGVPYSRVYELARHRKEPESAAELHIYGAHSG